jgi:two-component system chemotaxis response regulator CheY
MKVLLVDDSGTMRTIHKRCLNKLRVTDVAEAEDGVQALKLFEGGAFDLVLTDWNMPNMDGLTLLKEIRKRNTKIPVVMVTTEAERSRIIEAREAGVSDYLVKPFTPDGLRERIELWVRLLLAASGAP